MPGLSFEYAHSSGMGAKHDGFSVTIHPRTELLIHAETLRTIVETWDKVQNAIADLVDPPDSTFHDIGIKTDADKFYVRMNGWDLTLERQPDTRIRSPGHQGAELSAEDFRTLVRLILEWL